MGLIPSASYEVLSFPFVRGSKLVLFSDGLFEMSKAQDVLFTEADLGEVLKDCLYLTAGETVKSICNRWSVKKYDKSQPDDISLLVIDFKK